MEESQPIPENSVRRVVLASFVGTTIEWYDFFLYGTAAALVCGQLFFPSDNEFVGTMAAYGSFARSYLFELACSRSAASRRRRTIELG